MKINKIIIISLVLFISTACDNSNPTSSDSESNSSWIFVANEGNYGAGNGSVSMIDDKGQITTIDNIGDVVQSVEVYKNKLFVIVNNSHKIMIYNITENGVNLPGIEISTENSSPREMVIIDDNIYFTNWETQDVKILNLQNNQIEESTISINGRPEDIIFDGTYIWVSIPEISKWDGNQGTEVAKIDPSTNEVIEYLEVGRGPQALLVHNNEIFISRTYYSDDWNTTYHGATKIGTEIIEKTYGSGAPCGGSMMSYENKIYRSQNWIPSGEEGIVPLDDELNFIATGRIGNYQSPSIIYHMENINGQIYITITDYGSTNLVKVLDNYGNEIASYTAGIMPGDLAYWKKSE